MDAQCILFFFVTFNFLSLRRTVVEAKSFEKTHNGDNGAVTCALDQPSSVIPLDLLYTVLLPDPHSCVAPGALCALQCLQDCDCTNYNYRRNSKTCEFFSYTPCNCAAVTGCYHAEVTGLQSCIDSTACMTSTRLTTSTKPLTSTASSVATSTYKATSPFSTTELLSIVSHPSLPAVALCDALLGTPNILVQSNLGYGLDQDWSAYKYGFSDSTGGYWVGMEVLHRMTNNGKTWKQCSEATDVNGYQFSIVYQNFVVDSESDGYTYLMSGATGPIDPYGEANRKYKFSTKDMNNQPCCCAEQAITCKGAWWYSCTTSMTSMTVVANGAGTCGFFWSLPGGSHTLLKQSYIRMKET